VAVHDCAGPHDEDNTTLDLMACHGVDRVRGASYVQAELPEATAAVLARRLADMRGGCFACSSAGHFAAACPRRPAATRAVVFAADAAAAAADAATAAAAVAAAAARLPAGAAPQTPERPASGPAGPRRPTLEELFGDVAVASPPWALQQHFLCARCGCDNHGAGTCYARWHFATGWALDPATAAPRAAGAAGGRRAAAPRALFAP